MASGTPRRFRGWMLVISGTPIKIYLEILGIQHSRRAFRYARRPEHRSHEASLGPRPYHMMIPDPSTSVLSVLAKNQELAS